MASSLLVSGRVAGSVGGRRQLWLMDADGGNQRQLLELPFEAWDPVWVKYLDQ